MEVEICIQVISDTIGVVELVELMEMYLLKSYTKTQASVGLKRFLQ